jgi:hypothetical protein
MAYTIRWYSVYDRTPPAAEALAALKADGMMVACRMEGDGVPEGLTGGVDLQIFDAAGEHSTQLLARSGSLGASMNGWWRWDAGGSSALDNRLRSGALLWKSGLSGALAEIGPDAAADAAWPLRWDGVRQGLLDSRYLTTFFAVMRQVKDKDRSSRLPGEAEAAVMAALKGLAERPSAAAADRFRTVTVDWIVRLRRVAGS